MPTPLPTNTPSDFEVFVTADRAFAAFERAALRARASIIAGFRIFDLKTPLVSDDARAIGETWFDLLVHVVRNGVQFDLAVSDFDPVYAKELHQQAWATVKQGKALVEVAGVPEDQVRIRALLHPATPGALPWLAFLPASMRRARALYDSLDTATRSHLPGFSSALPDLHPVTHHQKLAVIDDEILYIGGLDLNERRFDTADHARPAEQTWSDVQIILRDDPAVAEARAHLESFDDVVRGDVDPCATRHVKRTLSKDRRFKLPFLSPRGVLSEIETLHLEAFAAANSLIYIETQFMRSLRIAEALAEAARTKPDLALILILPALPESAAFAPAAQMGIETRYGLSLERDALAVLREGFGARATIASPVRPVIAPRESRTTLAGSPMIYVHNKVLVRDSDFAFVGSANMNGRSLHWDTEAGVAILKPARIEVLRNALFAHWWRGKIDNEWADPARMQPLWQTAIARNSVCLPDARHGFLVAHDTQVHDAEGQSLPLVTDNMV